MSTVERHVHEGEKSGQLVCKESHLMPREVVVESLGQILDSCLQLRYSRRREEHRTAERRTAVKFRARNESYKPLVRVLHNISWI